MKDRGGHSDIALGFTLAHNSALLASLGDDTIKCAMRSPRFPVCGHSRSAGFSLFSSSFRSRWFLSGSYLAVYSDHFIYLFITLRFVGFSEHRWTPFTLSAQLPLHLSKTIPSFGFLSSFSKRRVLIF